jgi:glycosyltransferase involved in cell wall biosynthesis
MPLAWRAVRRVDDADVVISSSHACAKAIRVGRGIPHVCYCYTPMRYAWDFQSEQARIAAPLHGPARLLMRGFRRWDVATSHRVTKFVAISHAVAERIAAAYGRTAEVIHPPVRTEFFTPGGERDDFFLYVGRLVAYKRADLVVEAFSELPTHRLVVVGHGHLEQQLRHRATSNVTFLGAVDDDRLRSLYRSARALVYPANEDFGITMAEAQACGTPVIGLARGGATDIVSDGETGWLVDVAHPREVRAAVRKASMESLSPVLVRARAEQFSAAEFRRKMLDVLREAAASSGASDI